jgi:hypothetical protein
MITSVTALLFFFVAPQPQLTIEDIVYQTVNDWYLNRFREALYDDLQESDFSVVDQNEFKRQFTSHISVDSLVGTLTKKLTHEQKTYLLDWYNGPEGRRFFAFPLTFLGDASPGIFERLSPERKKIIGSLEPLLWRSWCEIDTLYRIFLQTEQLFRLEPFTRKEIQRELETLRLDYQTHINQSREKALNRIAFRTMSYTDRELTLLVRFLESPHAGTIGCLTATELWLHYEHALAEAVNVVFPEKEIPTLGDKSMTVDIDEPKNH